MYNNFNVRHISYFRKKNHRKKAGPEKMASFKKKKIYNSKSEFKSKSSKEENYTNIKMSSEVEYLT